MRRLFATDFGIWPLFKGLEQISDAMAASQDQWAALANYLVLFDQIVIPTGNLQILPVLRIMLGEDIFEELVRQRVIVLSRVDRCLFYISGAGLQAVSLDFKSTTGPYPNMFHGYFKPLDEAIDIALGKVCKTRRADHLVNLPITQIS